MGSGLDLLRLLEPAVRPDGAVGSGRSAGQPFASPIEQQSFEQLLDQASVMEGTVNKTTNMGEQTTAPVTALSPLNDLSRVDRIENASLRSLFGVQATPPAV